MSYKSENWKEELQKVRSYIKEEIKAPVVEKTQDEIVLEEIDLMLLTDFDESIEEETQESQADADNKLLEKNMLGRLAKSLELTEDKKTMLFNYFEKGELVQ